MDEVSKQVPGHKHLGRQTSFNLMERSLAVRVAMIELQKTFDCIVGASHVTTAVGGGHEQRYDYMISLFKHVDALATLLLFWKSKAAGMVKIRISFQIGSALRRSCCIRRKMCMPLRSLEGHHLVVVRGIRLNSWYTLY